MGEGFIARPKVVVVGWQVVGKRGKVVRALSRVYAVRSAAEGYLEVVRRESPEVQAWVTEKWGIDVAGGGGAGVKG